ncbi:hypothetical protein D3C87_2085470 [compost metagenome]
MLSSMLATEELRTKAPQKTSQWRRRGWRKRSANGASRGQAMVPSAKLAMT